MAKKMISILLVLCLIFSLAVCASAEGTEEEKDYAKLADTIAAGNYHSVWIKGSGSVGAVGRMSGGRLETTKWKNVVKVAAHEDTVALLCDGTVIATKDVNGKHNIENWTDIVDIDINYCNTIGLTSAGTVVCAGANTYDQCDVSSWEDIVDVTVSTRASYGLKSDGTVVSTGDNDAWQRDVENWTDIVAISAGNYFVVGLKADGTVVGAGQCPDDLKFWSDIVAIDAGSAHVVGLRADGTVVADGWNDNGQCSVGGWTDIVAVSGGLHHTLALKADGTLVAAGSNGYNQCKVRN